jgi:predicted lipid-binding transport protein (Tim44 family)
MIAAFLVLRLRSILGRRTGFERPTELRPQPRPTEFRGETIEGHAEPVPAGPVRAVPDPGSPTGQTLQQMSEIDRNFDAGHFLSGAEAAFRMIVTAYATGKRDLLHNLLSDEMYRAFETAISAREAASQVQQSEIKEISQASIDEAGLRASLATITVRFVSDQISVTNGPDGLPVAGAEAVTEFTDLWTFERDLAVADPTWRLVAARSA